MGNSSAARITKGICEGLAAHDMLAGLVPVDTYDSDKVYPGSFAEVGLLLGPPTNAELMRTGCHERYFVLLAVNSSWVPKQIVRGLPADVTLVSPSQWGARTLEAAGAADVTVFPHGLSAEFKPLTDMQATMTHTRGLGYFDVLHLSSSAGQRKGTEELLRAWEEASIFISANSDTRFPRLLIITEGARHREDVRAMVGPQDGVRILGRFDGTESRMAELYQSGHVVCQPSRGEGFGLVPLEARACGVPVVMTDCTGHSEHAHGDGVVVVPSGPAAPIDDGPGAQAPTVGICDLVDALLVAADHWDSLRAEAQRFNRDLWSWEAVTKKWLDAIER
jgi:glycosyltransferase involved in cell wall biosynthesis